MTLSPYLSQLKDDQVILSNEPLKIQLISQSLSKLLVQYILGFLLGVFGSLFLIFVIKLQGVLIWLIPIMVLGGLVILGIVLGSIIEYIQKKSKDYVDIAQIHVFHNDQDKVGLSIITPFSKFDIDKNKRTYMRQYDNYQSQVSIRDVRLPTMKDITIEIYDTKSTIKIYKNQIGIYSQAHLVIDLRNSKI